MMQRASFGEQGQQRRVAEEWVWIPSVLTVFLGLTKVRAEGYAACKRPFGPAWKAELLEASTTVVSTVVLVVCSECSAIVLVS